MLMAAITEGELKDVLHSFQKYKILGPDGCPIEFYLGLFELVGGDLLRVVKESRVASHIHVPLHFTFIALIPKSDNSSTYVDFYPISLYNCLYKIISKVITKRIKEIISRTICREQFGFL